MPSPEEIVQTFADFAELPSGSEIYFGLADKLTAAVLTWNGDNDVRNYAVALLAAHMMTRAGLGSSGSVPGAVTSERIGSAAISYAAPVDTGANDLVTTRYGRQLMELRDLHIMAPRTSAG